MFMEARLDTDSLTSLGPGLLAFLGAVVGAPLGVYLTKYLATRPRRVVSSGEADSHFASGSNSQANYVVAEKFPLEYFRPIHEGAQAKWGEHIVEYEEIEHWLRDGARGPSGKPTINKRSSRNPHATADALIGHVFRRHSSRCR